MSLSGPKLILHLEGLTVLIAATWAYHAGGFPWWPFAVFLLAPDLAMLGYTLGSKLGATLYNVAHTYVAVGLFWLAGNALDLTNVLPICLIWLAHIGLDRLIGYGLKYPTAFKDTHLGKV